MKFSHKTIVTTLFALAVCTAAAQTRQTREEYIERYKSIAIAHMERYGIPASITLAQGILESDSGNSQLSRSSNNHFGIKCKKSWKGERVYHDDDAKGECFRAYPSVEASYQDHAEFLDSSPRYDSLFAYQSNDYRNWARGLKAAGYATAPDYAPRLIAIIEKYKLYLLDQEDGGTIYSSYRNSALGEESWFAASTSVNSSDEKIDPDSFRVSVNVHDGYNIYRTNHACYIVAKKDDTYRSIGGKFQISERTLRKFNDAERTASLQKGDIIYIDRKKPRWLGNVMQHTVLDGETLHSLSQSYGIRLKSLARLNSMRTDAELRAGSIIRLR